MTFLASYKKQLITKLQVVMLFFTVFMMTSRNLSADSDIYGYERIIVGGTDLTVPNGGSLPPVNVATLIDPYNVRMLAIGNGLVYSQEDVNQMREEAFEYFLNTYGLDFKNGIHDTTTDSYSIYPNAMMIQVTRMGSPDQPLTFDSENKKRAGEWFGYEVGVLVLMTSNGVFPGGIRAGVPYFAGDLLAKYTYNFVKPNKDWTKAKYREEIKGFPDWPSRQTLNSFGVTDTFGQIRVEDSQGNSGFLISTVNRDKDLNNNWVLTGRLLITWPVQPSDDD